MIVVQVGAGRIFSMDASRVRTWTWIRIWWVAYRNALERGSAVQRSEWMVAVGRVGGCVRDRAQSVWGWWGGIRVRGIGSRDASHRFLGKSRGQFLREKLVVQTAFRKSFDQSVLAWKLRSKVAYLMSGPLRK